MYVLWRHYLVSPPKWALSASAWWRCIGNLCIIRPILGLAKWTLMEDSFCIQFVLLNVFLKTSAIVVQSMKFFFFLGNGKLFSSLGKSYLLCRKVIMQKGFLRILKAGCTYWKMFNQYSSYQSMCVSSQCNFHVQVALRRHLFYLHQNTTWSCWMVSKWEDQEWRNFFSILRFHLEGRNSRVHVCVWT